MVVGEHEQLAMVKSNNNECS